MAMRILLVGLCREGRLGKSDDGRRDDASTHEVLHFLVEPSSPGALLLAGIRRRSGETVRIARSCCDSAGLIQLTRRIPDRMALRSPLSRGRAGRYGARMEKRKFGRTGLSVSVLTFGCGAVGGLMTRGAPADQERAVARALEAGVNHFDTAALYGDGASEENLGRVLGGAEARRHRLAPRCGCRRSAISTRDRGLARNVAASG